MSIRSADGQRAVRGFPTRKTPRRLARRRHTCVRNSVEYPLRIGKQAYNYRQPVGLLNSPAPPSVVGRFHKRPWELACKAIVPWTFTSPPGPIPRWSIAELLRKASSSCGCRKMEFDVPFVLEAGKHLGRGRGGRPEAIDFCDYYAPQMLKLASPDRRCNCRAKPTNYATCRSASASLSALNFPLAIPVGMTTVAGRRQHGGSEAVERHARHRYEVR